MPAGRPTGALPVPERDVDSAPFWEGLSEHRVVLQSCEACDRRRFPAMAHCPFCATAGGRWQELSGQGRIYSWIVVRHAFWPEFEDQVPYALATVDLDDGVRLVGRIDDVDTPDFGLRVQARYVDHEEWTELRFEAVAA